MSKHLICLHGFWGSPSDWDFLVPFCKKNNIYLHTPDLFEPGPLSSNNSFEDWSKSFKEMLDHLPEPKFLLGYSLGGRLAAYSAFHNPKMVQKLILVSAHLGLANEFEQKSRLKNDLAWAQRFLKEDWENLEKDWNAQPVLQGTHKPLFRKGDSDLRRHLGLALSHWSLGRQPLLESKITQCTLITGDKDSKFTIYSQDLSRKHKLISHKIIPNAGHRVCWDNPTAFTKELFLALNAV